MEDFGQELAVTKNDIKHLQDDISEIKNGVNEINSTILTLTERMDEKYVRKEEYKSDKQETTRKFETIQNRANILLGAVLSLFGSIIAAVIGGWILFHLGGK